MIPTKEYLREHFHYDPVTGWLTRIKFTHPRQVKLGSYNNDGYLFRWVQGKNWGEHVLVWIYHHGYLPEQIDHINGIRDDNRIGNLRPATNQLNQGNTHKLRSDNTSGVKGVTWHKARRKWCARIKINGKTKHLGLYADIRDAYEAYKRAADAHFGEFSNAIHERLRSIPTPRNRSPDTES